MVVDPAVLTMLEAMVSDQRADPPEMRAVMAAGVIAEYRRLVSAALAGDVAITYRLADNVLAYALDIIANAAGAGMREDTSRMAKVTDELHGVAVEALKALQELLDARPAWAEAPDVEPAPATPVREDRWARPRSRSTSAWTGRPCGATAA
jgi:hypothetical protein